jgi:hypothetical protein
MEDRRSLEIERSSVDCETEVFLFSFSTRLKNETQEK